MNETAHAAGIEGQLLDLFLFMGSAWVLYLLLGLSVVSVAITAERLLHFFLNREDVESLAKKLNGFLEKDDVEGARTMLTSRTSHVSRILTEGVDAVGRGASAVEEIIAGSMLVEKLKM